MARAMFAPVIGRPASCSQNIDLEVLLLGDGRVRRGHAAPSYPRADGRVASAAMQITPGTRAFVTGASRGIGAALAEALAARGAVLGLARPVDRRARRARRAACPAPTTSLACDVGDARSVHDALERFVAQAGGLDLLVANAGITHYGPFRNQPLAERRGR